MSTNWVKVQLSREQALSGIETTIHTACGAIFVAAGGPRGAALFADASVARESGRALYFSPVMASMCGAVIAGYNPVATSPPKLNDVVVLFSSGDVSSLLET
jgi:hypothetical protein